jgi:hypothetical protein
MKSFSAPISNDLDEMFERSLEDMHSQNFHKYNLLNAIYYKEFCNRGRGLSAAI